MTFPPRRDGSPSYAEAFMFDGERMHPARIVDVRWLTAIEPDGGDASAIFRQRNSAPSPSAAAPMAPPTPCKVATRCSVGPAKGEPNPVTFHQGGAQYTWDGESAYGMIERSLPDDQIAR